MKTTKVIYNLLIIFILSLTLTSCASRNNTQFKSQTWSENKKNISSIKNYSAKGKFAYVSSQNSFSAYFSILQTNSNMTIEATNLIGINLFTIKITKNEISFYSDKANFNGPINEANNRLKTETGLTFPVSKIKYWVLGLPNQNNDIIFNKDNLVYLLTSKNGNKDSWKVRYDKYQFINGYPLPETININNKNVKIKLVINSWDIENV